VGAPPPPPGARPTTQPPRPATGSRAVTPASGFSPGISRVAQSKVPVSFNLDSALSAVDEAHERWLIQKDRLDFGPFRLAEVKHQIEKGQIVGDHTIVDMENGERRKVREHQLLRDLVTQVENKREATRQVEIAEMEARAHRRRMLTALGVIAAVLLVGLPVAGYVAWKKGVFEQKVVYRDRIVTQTGEELHVEFSPMKVEPPKKHGKGGHGGGGAQNLDGFDEVTSLGDATESGGDETLGQDVVQSVMQRNYSVLKGCILEEKHRDPGLQSVSMEFIIRGSGQVSAVRVNGKTKTPFQSCLLGKMRTFTFPRFNGSRTFASFSLAFK
jgi:hypothetical protein